MLVVIEADQRNRQVQGGKTDLLAKRATLHYCIMYTSDRNTARLSTCDVATYLRDQMGPSNCHHKEGCTAGPHFFPESERRLESSRLSHSYAHDRTKMVWIRFCTVRAHEERTSERKGQSEWRVVEFGLILFILLWSVGGQHKWFILCIPREVKIQRLLVSQVSLSYWHCLLAF
jgi:hypothetical protein